MNDSEKMLLSSLENFIQKENIALAEKLENKIDKHLAGMKYWGIGGIVVFCVTFTSFFGFLFYFVNDQYNTRIERLEISAFHSQEAIILNEDPDRKKRRGAVKRNKK